MTMYDPVVETLDPREQFKLDRDQYAVQLGYLFKHSAFYQKKLGEAGIHNAGEAGPLECIADLPFTEKDELRRTQAEQPPFGAHLACDQEQLVRVFSTSGTTGVPCFIGLTRNDLDMYATNVARGYTAAGFTPAHRLVVGFNAGPFVAGAVYYGFDKIGCTVAPIGTGNTERLLTSIQRLSATGISCTPSYALHLAEAAQDMDLDPSVDFKLRTGCPQ